MAKQSNTHQFNRINLGLMGLAHPKRESVA